MKNEKKGIVETSIVNIHKDGLEISLMNSSRWRLNNVGDMTKTILWYPTQRIKIKKLKKESVH